MKKIAILASAALLLAAGVTSEAVNNVTTTSGERRILTDSKKIAKVENGKVTLALGMKINQKDTLMAIVAYCDANLGHPAFIKGDLVKARLSDDTVIELGNIIEKYETHKETQVTHTYDTSYGFVYGYGRFGHARYVPYECTQMIPEVSEEKIENSYGLYPITKQQMMDILAKGMVKFRIELEDRDIDLEGSKVRNLRNSFSEMVEQLKATVAAGPGRTDF